MTGWTCGAKDGGKRRDRETHKETQRINSDRTLGLYTTCVPRAVYTVHTCKLYEQSDTHNRPGGPRKAWERRNKRRKHTPKPQREAVVLCPSRERVTAQSHRTRCDSARSGTPALSRDADALQPPRSDSAEARIGGPADRRTDKHHSVRVARPTPSHRRMHRRRSAK